MDAMKCEAMIQAAETGSLTAAAERLGYTQSGITRMLGSLEEEIGFSLFVRSKKGVQLTENGKAMMPLFREIVRAEKNAKEFSAQICGVVKGSLTVGCYYSISAMWMPVILKKFRSLFPGVSVRMQEGGNREMAAWMHERSVDCCFCAKPHGVVCDWIPVFQDELVVWLPKDHPSALKDSFPTENLEREPFIHTSPDHDTDQDRLLSELQLHPKTCFTTRDGFTTYNMVAAGLGISFNQRLIAQKWDQGIVAQVPFDPPQFVELGIAVPAVKEASPAAQKLIECAEKCILELTEGNETNGCK